MTSSMIYYLVAFVLLGIVVLLAGDLAVRRYRRGRMTLAELQARIQPVDLGAFLALQRSMQAHCLENLSAREVRAIRRRFSLAAWDYVNAVRRNAAVYVELAQLASASSDAELAYAGRALATAAFAARLQASRALYRTAAQILFPSAEVGSGWLPTYRTTELLSSRLRMAYQASLA